MSAPITSQTLSGQESPHTVLVHVNNKPVEVPAPKASGLEIKQAAIKAGQPIREDFVLSEELPNGRTEIVGDIDIVTVNSQSRFVAIAPDDNS